VSGACGDNPARERAYRPGRPDFVHALRDYHAVLGETVSGRHQGEAEAEALRMGGMI
jgi:hypothetical protein